MWFCSRRSEEWAQLGGLQSGLSVQHRGADLHRHQQPAAGRRRPRVPDHTPDRRGRGPGARPDPLPDRQPGPQPDLSSPIDLQTRTLLTTQIHTLKLKMYGSSFLTEKMMMTMIIVIIIIIIIINDNNNNNNVKISPPGLYLSSQQHHSLHQWSVSCFIDFIVI